MNTRSFVTLWIIGVCSVIVWFWGDRLGIPTSALGLAQTLAVGLIGYAVNAAKGEQPEKSAPQPQPQPEQSQ